MEGEVKHQEHNAQEKGNGGIPVGEDGVDTHASPVLPALMAFTTDSAATFSMKSYRMAARAAFRSMPESCSISMMECSRSSRLVLPQLQHLQEGLVPLNELRGTEPGRPPPAGHGPR